MALLATLEGDGNITLDDLFNVNDFLGVKYFGVDNWNIIKDFVCKLTQKAANQPALFCIANIDKDFSKPSQLSCALLGYNDELGVCAMGSTAWNTLKCKLDDELLGFSLKSVAKKVGGAVKTAANVATTVATAPIKAGEYLINETPLKYTPGAMLYNKTQDLKETYIDDPTKNLVQTAVDMSSGAMYDLATKTPLKYTGTGQLVKLVEETREASGVTSPGTANVEPSQEEIIAQKRAAAEAAAKAASKASTIQSKQITASNKLKAQKEATAAAQAAEAAAQQAAAQAQQETAATQQALDVMESRVTSKYAPIILAGVFGLLALTVLKK